MLRKEDRTDILLAAPKKKNNKKKRSGKAKNNGDAPKTQDAEIDTHANEDGEGEGEDSEQSPPVRTPVQLLTPIHVSDCCYRTHH
jgi:hypothetical protein